jgi:hypothetical protein
MNSGPIYNTILFYIFFITIILIIKPKIMYCNKNKCFKPFGCEKGQTLFCFPIACITSIIVLYLIFLMIDIIQNYMNK